MASYLLSPGAQSIGGATGESFPEEESGEERHRKGREAGKEVRCSWPACPARVTGPMELGDPVLEHGVVRFLRGASPLT